MTTILLCLLCLALGIWIGRWWAYRTVLTLLDTLGLGKPYRKTQP